MKLVASSAASTYLVPASRWLLAWLILRSSKWRRNIPPKRQLHFRELHGVISQKIIIAVRTSSSARYCPAVKWEVSKWGITSWLYVLLLPSCLIEQSDELSMQHYAVCLKKLSVTTIIQHRMTGWQKTEKVVKGSGGGFIQDTTQDYPGATE
jgi:hypothetical protein